MQSARTQSGSLPIDWYLKAEQEQMKQGENAYSDEQYDHALYLAIQKAEDYLQPFFKYDLGKIYAIAWDCEEEWRTRRG